MTKPELITAIAEKTEMTKKASTEFLDAIMDVITEALVEGDEVNLVGFGKFETVERAARTGRNPQTGEAIDIPESRVPHFKPSKTLKDYINE